MEVGTSGEVLTSTPGSGKTLAQLDEDAGGSSTTPPPPSPPPPPPPPPTPPGFLPVMAVDRHAILTNSQISRPQTILEMGQRVSPSTHPAMASDEFIRKISSMQR
jgi:hypothetical protein